VPLGVSQKNAVAGASALPMHTNCFSSKFGILDWNLQIPFANPRHSFLVSHTVNMCAISAATASTTSRQKIQPRQHMR
jgi:hypothetical protein